MQQFNLPKEYLSASAISTLLRCPKQFEFRYIHEIISKPNAAAITGKAAHGAFEQYYADAINTKTVRMTAKSVADISVDVLKDELVKAELKLSDKEYDEVAEDLQDLTSSYIEHVAPSVRPLSVEMPFTYTSQCGVDIFGYLDLVESLVEEENPEDPSTLGIADYKVTKKKWALQKLTNSLQFNLYTMAMGINRVSVHNLVKGARTKVLPKKAEVPGVVDITNKIRLLTHDFNPAYYQHFENMIYLAAQTITSGIFMPCDPEAWCCNDEWCGYWTYCRGAGLRAG